jgi:hypothetical protein
MAGVVYVFLLCRRTAIMIAMAKRAIPIPAAIPPIALAAREQDLTITVL